MASASSRGGLRPTPHRRRPYHAGLPRCDVLKRGTTRIACARSAPRNAGQSPAVADPSRLLRHPHFVARSSRRVVPASCGPRLLPSSYRRLLWPQKVPRSARERTSPAAAWMPPESRRKMPPGCGGSVLAPLAGVRRRRVASMGASADPVTRFPDACLDRLRETSIHDQVRDESFIYRREFSLALPRRAARPHQRESSSAGGVAADIRFLICHLRAGFSEWIEITTSRCRSPPVSARRRQKSCGRDADA